MMKKKVCVVGLGHIGLPTACILATSGYEVLGVDTNPKVIQKIQSANSFYVEPGLQGLIQNAIHKGSIKVSALPAQADIFIIAVPTPLNADMSADISLVESAVEAIFPYFQKNTLLLIESTCPIGTTDSIALKLQKTYPEIHIAYCPERVLPGNILLELIHNDRVVGGVDKASTSCAAAFYQSFVKGEILSTNSRTAEAVKLSENAYRDINIAFANELSMIADRANLNVDELILLANRHPRVDILTPGTGVGGHCLAVDPWFLASAAPDQAILIKSARKVNANKTDWVLQKIIETAKATKTKVIACLGLTYKPDVTDLRGSPALKIVETLEKEFTVLRVDPYVTGTESLDNAISLADMIVGLVKHQAFIKIPKNNLVGKHVLDFAGVFK
jgi:UDP-N-acetyl-D-mannosaminuronic acid dehydrogenase